MKPIQSQIPSNLELLSEKEIRHYLNDNNIQISDLILLKSIDSTNKYLLQSANKFSSGTVCVAEHQTAGQGRRGKSWHSPFGANIYLSMLWNFNKDPGELAGLSIAIAVAVVRVLNEYGVKDEIQLKWPNDILVAHKKLAGILIELSATSYDLTHVVIGLGLNLQMSSSAVNEIDQPWIDLFQITKQQPQRNYLISLILKHFVTALQQFDQQKLKPFINEWNNHDIAKQKEVILQTAHGNIHGIAKGITERGELIIIDADNNTRCFLSGEVSMKIM